MDSSVALYFVDTAVLWPKVFNHLLLPMAVGPHLQQKILSQPVAASLRFVSLILCRAKLSVLENSRTALVQDKAGN